MATTHTPESVSTAWVDIQTDSGSQVSALKEIWNLLHIRQIENDVPYQDQVEQRNFFRPVVTDQLATLKQDRDSSIEGLRSSILKVIQGNQPKDVDSVLLRRGAIQRARAVSSPEQALTMLEDAIALQDHSQAYALGRIAGTQSGWGATADLFTQRYGHAASAVQALSQLEYLESSQAMQVRDSIVYSPTHFDE